MKIIKKPNEKIKNIEYFKNFLRDILIVSCYVFGFMAYAFIYLIWNINLNKIDIGWISIPIIGLILGLIHIIFIYKGSLICRTLTMFGILIYVFILPVIIALVN